MRAIEVFTAAQQGQIFDNLNIGMFVVDYQTKSIIYHNQFITNELAISGDIRQNVLIEGLIKKTFSQLEQNQNINNSSNDFLHEGKKFSYTFQIQKLRKKGDFVVFTIQLINNFIFSLETIQNQDVVFTKVLDNIPLAIAIMDSYNRLVLFNKTFMQLTGATRQMYVTGVRLPNILSINKYYSVEQEDDKLEKFLCKNLKGEEKIIYKKEEFIRLNNEQIKILVLFDITNVEESRQAIINAKKNQYNFFAKVSHEIRTPLSGVIGMADALLNTELKPNQYENSYFIKKSADLLLTIINDVLDFSKIELGKMQLENIPFSLKEEINLSVDSFRFSAKEKGIGITSTFSQDLPKSVIGDPFRIRQIVNNLLSNSIKFTREGKIVVSTELIRENFGTATVLISVEDTGIGIPEEKLNEVFGSFRQVDESTTRKFGGTGLGTTISKQLVEMMDGEIWVESPSSISTTERFPGSKFSFTLELLSDEKIQKDVAVEYVDSPDKLKTLIIDSRDSKESIINDNLRKLEIPVDLLHEEDDIVFLLKNQYIKYKRHKLIFIEDSPDFDGMAIAKAIEERDLGENYIITVLSSNHKADNYVRAKKYKVDYYIVKPYEPIVIQNILTENFPNFKFDTSLAFQSERLRTDLKILVAEDNFIGQKIAKTIFKTIGYEIDIAENGNDVINLIQKNNYDVIFMDAVMPVKDGLETTKEIRQMGRHLPIIAMTGNTLDEDRDKALQIGMDDYIIKPVMVDTVKKMLMKWFGR